MGTPAGTPQAGQSASGVLDRDRVEQRAYELYLARGGTHGQALEDWLAAERELSGETRSPDRES